MIEFLPRVLALLMAVLSIVVAIKVGKLLQSSWSLTSAEKVVRYLFAMIAAVGVWIGIGAFGSAPHLDSGVVSEGQPDALVCGELELTLQEASEREVPAIVDFTADWCKACEELREQTLNHPSVVARSDEFMCAEVDLTGRMDEQTEALRNRFGVQSLPHISFMSAEGEHVGGQTIRGFIGPSEFLGKLDKVTRGEAGAESRFERTLNERGWLIAFLVVFIGGIATSLTPCVYPLIPVTIALFGAQEAKTRTRALLLSLTYVLGIVITYTALGVVAALTGSLFGSALQNPWIVGAIGLLFVLLAMSMLGMFELRLPSGLQNLLSKNREQGFATAFVMGLIAGIIAAPCVGPILSGVLLFIADTQDVVLGSALMATFAAGMGVLFVILGTFSSLINRLPASGPWMEGVKAIFAIIFIVAAFYFIAPMVPVLGWLQDLPWLIAVE